MIEIARRIRKADFWSSRTWPVEPADDDAFRFGISRRLQGQSSALALPLTWIEQLLSEVASDNRATGSDGESATGR